MHIKDYMLEDGRTCVYCEKEIIAFTDNVTRVGTAYGTLLYHENCYIKKCLGI